MPSESIARINAFRALVKESRSVVLQYFRECDNLRVWPWPTSAEARISPSAMQEHRISHRMLGPCCLCPMLDANKPDFIEAAIYKASDGEHTGHFVATCAKDDCGYFVPLERLCRLAQGPVRCYVRRTLGERIPPRVTHPSENSMIIGQSLSSSSKSLKQSTAKAKWDVNPIIRHRPPSRRPSRKTADLLAKLDSIESPGISEWDFVELFHRCGCGYVVTRRSFRYHECMNENGQ